MQRLPKARRGRILFINAIDEVTRERAQSFLTDDHVQHIVNAYLDFKDRPGFARVVTIKEVEAKDFNLSIPLFVEPNPTNGKGTAQKSVLLSDALNDWLKSSDAVAAALKTILPGMMLLENRKGLHGNDRSKLLIDRTGWTPVRFEEAVENVNETESDPMAAGIERYIGLEHLEPGSLHIRTWGDVAEGTTFSRRCRPGQVLFGKRRAYQRKVAVAEFDAVVSGDIYVLAPKNDRLLPQLLPFLCLSERFFQYAIETSAGSLSPRTNWSSLSVFEFDLPPIDQQLQVGEILWSLDQCIECACTVLDQFKRFRDAWLAARFKEISGERTVALTEVASSIRNGMVGKVADGYVPEGVVYLVSKNVRSNRLQLDELSFVSDEFHRAHPKSQLQPFDILTVQSGHVGETCVVPPDLGMANCHALIITTPKFDVVDPYFISFYLNSPLGKDQVARITIGSTLQHINTSEFQKLKIPLPSLEEQRLVCEFTLRTDRQMEAYADYVATLRSLKTQLIHFLT